MNKWGLDIDKAPPAVVASKEPIIRFFSFHDAHPVALTMVLMEKFGHQWIVWEPETLRREILETFNATSVSDHNWQKIQAVRTLLSAIGFWHDWGTFERVIQALNNNIPRFDMSHRCSLAQLMAGVDIANSVREEEFGDEVAKYIAACAIEEGVMYLPPPLKFAQDELSDHKYVCGDCGNVDDDDLEDGRCDWCVGRHMDEKPLNGKPSKGVPDNVGRNIKKFSVRDPSGAKKRYDEIKNLESVELDEESADDVQAGKLAVAYKYMRLRSRQLVEQLEELKGWVTR